MSANVVLFLLNEIYKLNQMWLFPNVLYVSKCTVCYCVVAYQILRGRMYFLHFILGFVSTPRTPRWLRHWLWESLSPVTLSEELCLVCKTDCV